jgi:hypothetical protein
MVHLSLNVVISMEKMAQILIKHQPLSRFLIFVAMIFFSYKDSIQLKIFQIGAVGDLVWII